MLHLLALSIPVPRDDPSTMLPWTSFVPSESCVFEYARELYDNLESPRALFGGILSQLWEEGGVEREGQTFMEGENTQSPSNENFQPLD